MKLFRDRSRRVGFGNNGRTGDGAPRRNVNTAKREKPKLPPGLPKPYKKPGVLIATFAFAVFVVLMNFIRFL